MHTATKIEVAIRNNGLLSLLLWCGRFVICQHVSFEKISLIIFNRQFGGGGEVPVIAIVHNAQQ